MLLLSYDWSKCLESYTNVILTLSTTKTEKLVVNSCGRYFSLAKFELIKLLDKLIATETEVSAVLFANRGKTNTTDNYVKITDMVGIKTL